MQYLATEAVMDERRRSQRFDVTKEVKGRIKPTMEVRVLNISKHGMLIESPCGLPPAGMCEITVEAPSGPRVIRARVARCRAQMVKKDDGKVAIRFHAGLEFPEDLAEGLEIQQLMSEVCTLEGPAESTESAEKSTAVSFVVRDVKKAM